MGKARLEAFSDAVIAIIITIIVLELKVPHGDSAQDLLALLPVFLSYVLSFIYVAIIRAQGADSILKRAVGRDWKGKLSPVLYVIAIISTLASPWVSEAIFVTAALTWLIPDRRIEKADSPGA